MNKEFEFKRTRIVFGIAFSLVMLLFSIWFIKDPDIFLRHKWSKPIKIQIVGGFGAVYFTLLFYSFVSILPRKIGVVISEEYLLDKSRFESLGKISWSEIRDISKVKKNSLEITFNEPIFRNHRLSFLKKVLHFMNNRRAKRTASISSALLNCSIEELYESINGTFNKSKSP